VSRRSKWPRRIESVWRRALHHSALRAQPRVLCNSIQKSGTHLIVGLAAALPGLRAYGRRAYWHHLNRERVEPRKRPTLEGEIRRLRKCLPGEIYRGHLAAAPQIADLLHRRGFKHLFVYRDPRDVVVSLMFWWERHQEIDAWPFRYFQGLASSEERLRFLIEGWPANLDDPRFPAEVGYPNVAERFAEFLPWLSDPQCLSIRFEDLVGPESKTDTYRRIAEYLLTDPTQDQLSLAVEHMSAGSDPSQSKTFRKGRSGDWRETLNAEHVALMKRYAGKLLVELGYEKDLDW